VDAAVFRRDPRVHVDETGADARQDFLRDNARPVDHDDVGLEPPQQRDAGRAVGTVYTDRFIPSMSPSLSLKLFHDLADAFFRYGRQRRLDGQLEQQLTGHP
jgi:hypothetical protein